jgi:hypothetical protein
MVIFRLVEAGPVFNGLTSARTAARRLTGCHALQRAAMDRLTEVGAVVRLNLFDSASLGDGRWARRGSDLWAVDLRLPARTQKKAGIRLGSPPVLAGALMPVY